MAAAWPLKAGAQRSGKLFRIGWFSAGPAGAAGQLDQAAGFIEGLRELGWIEGKDVVFEERYAENRVDRISSGAGAP
jgi:putative ABC transport system substrate-binding protein